MANRFHLLQNASAALEELLRGGRRHIERVETLEAAADQTPASLQVRTLSATKQLLAARRKARMARWEQDRTMREGGFSIRKIAHELGMARATVRRLLTTPEPTRNRQAIPRPIGNRRAVEATLALPWSNGPVVGHIHRVKLHKRQGYGRAKLDLLRPRMLAG